MSRGLGLVKAISCGQLIIGEKIMAFGCNLFAAKGHVLRIFNTMRAHLNAEKLCV